MKSLLKKINLRYIFLILFLLSLILIFILYLPYRNQLKLQAELKAKGIEFSTQPYGITKSFQFLERVIGEEISGLEVTDVSQIPHPDRIPELVYVIIQTASSEDIKKLSFHNKLRAVEIRDYTSESLESFTDITNLDHLILIADSLKDVSPLKKMTKLESLVIWADKVEDISGISSLVNLNGLSFFSKSLRDYSPMYKLPKLEYLTLKDGITDETIKNIIENVPQLKNLDLDSMSHPNANVVYKSRRHAVMEKTKRTVYKKRK